MLVINRDPLLLYRFAALLPGRPGLTTAMNMCMNTPQLCNFELYD